MIAEYDGSDTLLRKFIYGPGIDEPICMVVYNAQGTETDRYWYHFDALNNWNNWDGIIGQPPITTLSIDPIANYLGYY